PARFGIQGERIAAASAGMGAARKRPGCEWLPRRFHRARAQGSNAQEWLNIFSCFSDGNGFGAHCKEGAKKQNAGAPKLGVRESFAIEPGREAHRDSWANQLEALRERDSDFPDGYVIQNVGERDTDHS